jgi:type IV pilus assembly protein PilA
MLDLKRRLAEARKSDEGFTLIELAVVILIIGILLLLAIPSFLGVRKRAQDKAAQSALRVGLTHAKAVYGDSDSYSSATGASIVADEPSYTSKTTSDGPKALSVFAAGDTWTAAALSKSGKCFFLKDTNLSGTFFASNNSGSATACSAASATPTVDNAFNSNNW